MCDATLLAQIYYYRWKRVRRGPPLLVTESEDPTVSALYDEASPLLPGGDRSEEPYPRRPVWQEALKYAAALLFVFGVGVVAWGVDKWTRKGTPPSNPEDEVAEWRSQVLGWISAALFRECVYCLEVFQTHSCAKSERGFRKSVRGFIWRQGVGAEFEGRDAQSRI